MPSGNITITPGRVLVAGPVTLQMLNDLGNPTARVDEGSIGPRELAPEAFTSENFPAGSFDVAKLAPGPEGQIVRTVAGVAVWGEETADVTQRYAARVHSIGGQAVTTDGATTQLLLQGVVFDLGGAFNTVSGRYAAPVAGIYTVALHAQADNLTGDQATMQVNVRVTRAGLYSEGGAVDATPSPNGQRWFCDYSALVRCELGETLELTAEVVDAPGTGQVTFSNLIFSVALVQPLS